MSSGDRIEELVRVHPHSLLVAHAGIGLDTEQCVVGLRILAVQIVAVVGGDQGQARFLAQLDKLGIELLLLGKIVIHELQVEAAGKELAVLPGRFPGRLHSPGEEHAGHLPLEAGGHGDEIRAKLGKQLLVHPGLVVESLQVGLAHQLDQVVVPLFVLGQQHQMVPRLRGGTRVLLGSVLRGHVDLAAHDGLEPEVLGSEVEVQGPEEIAVVGDRCRALTEGHGAGTHVPHLDRPVQKAVFGMAVQVHEVGHNLSFKVQRSKFKVQNGSLTVQGQRARRPLQP